MYYVWKSEIRAWRGGIVRAELRPFRKDWYDLINIFACEQFRELMPEALEFDVVGAGGGLPDHICSANFEPCSPRLVELVRGTGVACEEVPTTLWDMRTKALLTRDYRYVHIMNCVEATDFDRSVGEVRMDRHGRPYLARIRHLVLRDDVLSQDIPIFRLQEAPRLVLVRNSFKTAYEATGLRGSKFTSVDQWNEEIEWGAH